MSFRLTGRSIGISYEPGNPGLYKEISHSSYSPGFHMNVFLTIQDLFCKDRSQSEVDQDDHAKDDTVISEELEVMFLDISK